MPEIDIADSDLPQHVLSVMLFPDDPALRATYRTRFSTEAAIQDSPEGACLSVSADSLRLLLDSPSRQEIRARAADATRQGVLAGNILAIIYVMYRCVPESEPSMNKAIHAMEQHGRKFPYADGVPMPVSERKLREAWNGFKAVAHLWAAHGLNKVCLQWDAAKEFSERSETARLLGASSELLAFGTEFVPQRSKSAQPFLSRDDCWQIPSQIAAIPLDLGQEPDRLLSYLSSYRA